MAGEAKDKKTGDQAQQSEDSARKDTARKETGQEQARPSKKEQDSQRRKWR